jgi:hypothetical protein
MNNGSTGFAGYFTRAIGGSIITHDYLAVYIGSSQSAKGLSYALGDCVGLVQAWQHDGNTDTIH